MESKQNKKNRLAVSLGIKKKNTDSIKFRESRCKILSLSLWFDCFREAEW